MSVSLSQSLFPSLTYAHTGTIFFLKYFTGIQRYFLLPLNASEYINFLKEGHPIT